MSLDELEGKLYCDFSQSIVTVPSSPSNIKSTADHCLSHFHPSNWEICHEPLADAYLYKPQVTHPRRETHENPNIPTKASMNQKGVYIHTDPTTLSHIWQQDNL
jgi:hypothetical protein